jgi:hypothetical protein
MILNDLYQNVHCKTTSSWQYPKECTVLFKYDKVSFLPIPVAVRSKAWVFGRSLTRIMGSNPTGGMDVCVVL